MSYTDRKENKFLLDYPTYARLLPFVEQFATPDIHSNKRGTYIINSLYFDTPTNRFFWEKIDGEKTRRKVRIRSYIESESGKPLSTLLEIKKKDKWTVYKEKAHLPFREAFAVATTGSLNGLAAKNFSPSEKKALDDVIFLYYKYNLRPVIQIAYERKPFLDRNNPKVRVTFDFNVKYRAMDFDTENAEMDCFAISPHLIVMEVKYSGQVPLWVSAMTQRFNLQLTTVSKYCEAMGKMQANKML